MRRACMLLTLILLSGDFQSRVNAQTYGQDTVAVRALLDSNFLTTPVSQVSKSTDGRVTFLDLTGLDIIHLPSQIGDLTALQTLIVSNNLLDTLPNEIWSLTQLTTLDLSGNGFKTLDARMGGFKKMIFLGVASNKLKKVPDTLFTLSNLEILLLSGNQLDSISESVADLPFLKYLDLSHNALQRLPYTLAAMDLDSLDLGYNQLADLPDFFTEMKPATVVRLSGNALCALSSDMELWATQKDATWKRSQQCGAGVAFPSMRRESRSRYQISHRLASRTGIRNALGRLLF